MGIKGYKVFNPDWTCRGFQYEVGKTFKHNGNIKMYSAGFHFCQKISDCFNYYKFNSNNKVAEVEAVGLVKTRGDKSVTDEIRIIREISWSEVLMLCNTGVDNTGFNNSGDNNSGDNNSGNVNSGNANSGSYNSGDNNSGDNNSGSGNSGSYNSGDNNSGDNNSGSGNSGRHNSGSGNSGSGNSGSFNSGGFNSGGHNSGSGNSGSFNSGSFNSGGFNSGSFCSGNWNSANFSSGFFNSMENQLYAFNKPLKMTGDCFLIQKGMCVLSRHYENDWWICSKNMTDKEKEEHPDYITTGGYLKTVDFKTACKTMWSNLDLDEKQAVKEIANFDAEVFKEITGIDVEKD